MLSALPPPAAMDARSPRSPPRPPLMFDNFTRHTPLERARGRMNLLKHAADLCTSLGLVLERLGPNCIITTSLDSDVKIDETAREVRRLEQHLHRQLQLINIHRNEVLAPVSRLPNDILRHIFSIPSEENWPHWSQFSVNVSHVNRRWRAVAVNTAALWATVRFTPAVRIPAHTREVRHKYWDLKAKEIRSEKAAVFLLRSRASPMAVELNCSAQPEDVTGPFIHHCGDRTDDLSFLFYHHCVFPRAINAIVPCIDATASRLRRLQLSFPSFTEYDMHENMTPLFSTPMPCLREVSFQNVPLSHSHGAYRMLAAVRKLEVIATGAAYFSADILIPLLRSSPELRDLRINISTSWVMAPTVELERVPLRHLVSYTVATGAWMERGFEFFEAPKLRYLEMDTSRCEILPFTFDSPIYDFLDVSKPPLQRLVVRKATPIVLNILRKLPSVRHLAFLEADVEFGGSYLQLLESMSRSCSPIATLPPGGGCICPNLETWSTDLELDNVHLQRLLEFATARQAHGRPLRRVVLTRWRKWNLVETVSQELETAATAAADGSGTCPPRDARLAALVDDFVIANWVFDRATERWEPDGVVRPESLILDDKPRRPDEQVRG